MTTQRRRLAKWHRSDVLCGIWDYISYKEYDYYRVTAVGESMLLGCRMHPAGPESEEGTIRLEKYDSVKKMKKDFVMKVGGYR